MGRESPQFDSPVEWHTVEGYRVSFDRRTDASRFIVMGHLTERHLRQFRAAREPIAKGLIEGNGYVHGTGEPLLILDHPYSDELPLAIQVGMLEAWKRMADRLHAAGRADGS